MNLAERPEWHCESCNTELMGYELIPDSDVEIVEAWGRKIPMTTNFHRCPICGSDEDLLEIKR